MSKTSRRLRRLIPKTEAEWLACSDPLPMLEVLRAKSSDRKIRLFALGCCRFTLTDSTPARTRRAVEIAELFVDGLASHEELLRARSLAFYAARQFHFGTSENLRKLGVHRRRVLSGEEQRLYFAAEAAHPYKPFRIGWLRFRLRYDPELMRVAPTLLRDVIGNPFRLVSLVPARLSPSVIELAQRIYDERIFDQMPLLAEALEAASCDDHEILSHCRGSCAHVRGCWVVDLILGKS